MIFQKPVVIVHSQHFHTNLYACFAGYILHKKANGSLRSDVYNEIASVGLLGKLSFQLPKMLVANSSAAIETAMQLGKPQSQLFYLPNVVDENQFLPSPNLSTGDELKFVFVGTCAVRKIGIEK